MQFIGGSVSKGSELQIEVAEFLWEDVEVTIKNNNFACAFHVCSLYQTKFIC